MSRAVGGAVCAWEAWLCTAVIRGGFWAQEKSLSCPWQNSKPPPSTEADLCGSSEASLCPATCPEVYEVAYSLVALGTWVGGGVRRAGARKMVPSIPVLRRRESQMCAKWGAPGETSSLCSDFRNSKAASFGVQPHQG